jgi:polyhydroxybutyrate depolymerase
MFLRFLATALLALFALPALGDTVKVDGIKRAFTVTCPVAGCGPNLPVILGFHGGFQQPSSFAKNAGFETLGVRAIMVYPLGRPALLPTWNAGTQPPSVWAERNDSDDLGFVEAILNYLETKYRIDRSRIFATGISNGGRFAWRIACETDWLAGVATIAGTESDENCGPVSHPPLLVISGTADKIEPFDGGGSGGAGIPFQIGIDLWHGARGSVSVLRPIGGKHQWAQPGIDTTSSVIAFFGLQ